MDHPGRGADLLDAETLHRVLEYLLVVSVERVECPHRLVGTDRRLEHEATVTDRPRVASEPGMESDLPRLDVGHHEPDLDRFRSLRGNIEHDRREFKRLTRVVLLDSHTVH